MIAPSDWLPPQALAFAGGAAFPIAVGLGSSLTHCAGMCGPIHFFFARQNGKKAAWKYHAGRILGYALLGAAAGWMGSLAVGSDSPAWRRTALFVLAGAYAIFGLNLLGAGSFVAARIRPWLHSRFGTGRQSPSRWAGLGVSRLLRRADGSPRSGWLFPVGLLASLLPCPSTHAGLLFALGLGRPDAGAAAMLALGVATLPVFVLIPVTIPDKLAWARRYAHVLGLVFLGLAAWRLAGGLWMPETACH